MKTFDEIKQALAGCKPGRCAPDCPYGDRIGCVQELHRDALAMIQQLEAQVPKWIGVEERLPERAVLAACFDPEMYCYGEYIIGYVARTDDSEFVIAENDHEILDGVTHWMPLPEPPKEDE